MHPLESESFYVRDVFPLTTPFISFALCPFRNYVLHLHVIDLYIFAYCSIRNVNVFPLARTRYTGSPVSDKWLGTFPWSWCLVCHLLLPILFIDYFNVIEVQLIYRAVLISVVQQSDLLYIYILFHILFHDGLSQDIEARSLCSTGGPCLSILYYIIVCIC